MLYRTLIDEKTVTVYANRTKKDWQVQIFLNGKEAFSSHISFDDLTTKNEASSFCAKNEIYEAWEQFLKSRTDNIGVITASVTAVISYNHQFSMDIFFGDDVFRCDKDGFINPKPFLIWYIGTKNRIPQIEQGEWEEFVSSMLSIADNSTQDPLVPDLLSILVSSIRAGQLHSDFCDALVRMVLSRGDAAWYVYKRDENHTLYVPSHVMDAIRRRTEMGKKAFRNYWIPYLLDIKDNRRRIGTSLEFEQRPRMRFWALDMQKIAETDDGIMDAIANLIDCEEENEIKREITNVTAE